MHDDFYGTLPTHSWGSWSGRARGLNDRDSEFLSRVSPEVILIRDRVRIILVIPTVAVAEINLHVT